MTEWIRNAWLGWQNYTQNGKLVALLLASLLLFWFVWVDLRKKHHTLVVYTTIAVICCICPLTAALLMAYQTKFYDYQWIWGIVPMTIVIALAGTCFWEEVEKKIRKSKTTGRTLVGVAVLLIALVYLSGRMAYRMWDTKEVAQNRAQAEAVIEVITEEGRKKDVFLWAPKEIMEYARALDGNICLPYGRNMWDGALNGYSYDIYGEPERLLYAWMCNAEETGTGTILASDTSNNRTVITGTGITGEEQTEEQTEAQTEEQTKEQTEEVRSRIVDGKDCLELAKELGVNTILLPDKLQPDSLAEIEVYLGMSAETLEGYYLFRIGGK